jgi:hypothetical protein
MVSSANGFARSLDVRIALAIKSRRKKTASWLRRGFWCDLEKSAVGSGSAWTWFFQFLLFWRWFSSGLKIKNITPVCLCSSYRFASSAKY